jgi:hypothetical protein
MPRYISVNGDLYGVEDAKDKIPANKLSESMKREIDKSVSEHKEQASRKK